MRKNLGVAILAVSIVFSALDLIGCVKPPLLRMRAHGGTERVLAIAFGSLSLKAIILLIGLLLAFWPSEK